MNQDIFLKWIDSGQISVPNMLLENYTDIGLNEAECMLLLQIYRYTQQGNAFPTPEQLAKHMTFTIENCSSLLRGLLRRGFMRIDENNEQVRSESYSLEPLWETLLIYIGNQEVKGQQQQIEQDVYSIFEQEFGRPLSPIECETLIGWLDQDQHDNELIIAALKEAVLSNKMNFRYIDRTLFEWKKNGVKTLQQAKAHGEKIRKYQ